MSKRKVQRPFIQRLGTTVEESWFDEDGHLHRENGLPARVDNEGYESYWNHGRLKKTNAE